MSTYRSDVRVRVISLFSTPSVPQHLHLLFVVGTADMDILFRDVSLPRLNSFSVYARCETVGSTEGGESLAWTAGQQPQEWDCMFNGHVRASRVLSIVC